MNPETFHQEYGMPVTDDQVLRACANVRDQQFAQFLVFAIGIAAEKHPDSLRAALAKVFDLGGIEDIGKRCMAVLAAVQATANETRKLMADLRREVDGLERRVGSIDVDLHKTKHLRIAE
jgi:hypothetical protein